MSILVIAEHTNASVLPATANTVTAAGQLGGEIDVLVAGYECQTAAAEAATLAGVRKVLKADAAPLGQGLAENVAPLIEGLASAYSHVLAPASTYGKNVLPRVAALLDVQQISDISAVESADTFVRPIYAGNALATVRSNDPIKLVTVRATAFDSALEGNNAPIEEIAAGVDAGLSRFAGQELTRSEIGRASCRERV